MDFLAIFPQISWFLLLNSISADSISAVLSFPQGTALIGDFLYNDRNKAKDRLRRVDLDKLTKEEYWTGFRLMRCVATFCSEIKIRPFSYCS